MKRAILIVSILSLIVSAASLFLRIEEARKDRNTVSVAVEETVSTQIPE